MSLTEWSTGKLSRSPVAHTVSMTVSELMSRLGQKDRWTSLLNRSGRGRRERHLAVRAVTVADWQSHRTWTPKIRNSSFNVSCTQVFIVMLSEAKKWMVLTRSSLRGYLQSGLLFITVLALCWATAELDETPENWVNHSTPASLSS